MKTRVDEGDQRHVHSKAAKLIAGDDTVRKQTDGTLILFGVFALEELIAGRPKLATGFCGTVGELCREGERGAAAGAVLIPRESRTYNNPCNPAPAARLGLLNTAFDGHPVVRVRAHLLGVEDPVTCSEQGLVVGFGLVAHFRRGTHAYILDLLVWKCVLEAGFNGLLLGGVFRGNNNLHQGEEEEKGKEEGRKGAVLKLKKKFFSFLF